MKGIEKIIASLAVLALVACGNGGGGDDDTATDEGTEPADDGTEVTGDPTEDPAEDPAGDPGTDPEEEIPAGPCGNGSLDSGEVCDDGNTGTEFCDTTTEGACLSDCSLLNATCGNSSTDDGEACDDGNDDSFDGCTTSCTVNDQSFGDPCRCTGGGCSALDFTAGTIVGCDGLTDLADSSRTVACMRSSVDTTYGITVYGANGACMLMAMGCEGIGCGLVPTTGDVDTITCPAGSALNTDVRTELGGVITITTKTCHQTCETQADCRWNETEPTGSPFEGDCGQWMCLPGGDGGERVCVDPRNEA